MEGPAGRWRQLSLGQVRAAAGVANRDLRGGGGVATDGEAEAAAKIETWGGSGRCGAAGLDGEAKWWWCNGGEAALPGRETKLLRLRGSRGVEVERRCHVENSWVGLEYPAARTSKCLSNLPQG